MPFAVHEERNTAFDYVKCFILIHVIMRWRSATWRGELRPHRKLSACAFAVEVNDYFLAKGVEHKRVILPDSCP
jgi:hypothetical protein